MVPFGKGANKNKSPPPKNKVCDNRNRSVVPRACRNYAIKSTNPIMILFINGNICFIYARSAILSITSNRTRTVVEVNQEWWAKSLAP